MNERVTRFLEENRSAEYVKKMKERNQLLLEAGLFEKNFPQDPENMDYNVYTNWDEEKQMYYQPVPIAVSDQEYAEIEKIVRKKENDKGGLFNNIGQKIMGLAKFLFWLGIIGSVILGMTVATSIEDDLSFIRFLLVVGIGILGSYISSWFLYGLGQLIDDTHEIRKNSEKE